MKPINLSTLFRTKGEAEEFLKHLAEVSSQVYKTDFDFDKVLLEELGIKTRDALVDLMKENEINVDEPSKLKQFFEQIKEAASTLPILGLTLAFEPKESTLKAISDWFSLNLKQQVIFDIKVNHRLIAGASLSFKGKIVENTIEQQVIKAFEEYLKTNRASIPTKDLGEAQDSPNKHISVEHFSMGR